VLALAAFFWLALTVVVCYVAHEKGRNAFAWFIVSLLFSPAIGMLAMLALPARPKASPPYQPPSEPGAPKAKTLEEYLNS